MTVALYLDDVDAQSAFGFALERAGGWADMPPRSAATVAVPGAPGLTLLSAPQEGARKLTFPGIILGLTADDARAKLDLLWAALGGVSVRLRTGDRPTREIVARLDEATVATTPSAHLIARELPVQLGFTAHDPYWRETSATSVSGIGVSGTAVPLGTAPVRPLVTVPSVSGTVTLTLIGADVVTLGEIGFAGLPSGTLVVNCATQTATIGGANALPYLSAGDFFAIDPATAAHFATAAWPKLALSAGTGSATYRKRWR